MLMQWIDHKINPWEFLLKTLGEEKILSVLSHNTMLQQYNWFIEAQNLGVKFGPHDITDEQIRYFTWIKEIVTDIQSKQKGK